jgi:hypothetical protein
MGQYAGKQRIGNMTMTNAEAAYPIGRLNIPKFQGPGRNRPPTTKTRIAIGIVKATKAAIAPTEKSAPIATSPAKMRRRRASPTSTLNQTAFTGVLVVLFTRDQYRDPGKQPSRA